MTDVVAVKIIFDKNSISVRLSLLWLPWHQFVIELDVWSWLLASFKVRERKYLSVGFIFGISEAFILTWTKKNEVWNKGGEVEKNTNANNANASNNTNANANAYADADANTKSTNKTPKQNFSLVSNLDTMGLRDIKTRIL